MIEKKTLWDSAGKAGLVLGMVCVAYLAITSLSSKLVSDSTALAMLISLFNTCLWIAKFVGCILLLKLFMKKFAASDKQINNSDTFRFGCATAFLSSLVYSASYLAWILFIQPDIFQESLDILMQNAALDSNSIAQIEEIMPKMPVLSFFWNLFYCWLFGTVVSAIFSKNIPSRNPFANNNIDEQ